MLGGLSNHPFNLSRSRLSSLSCSCGYYSVQRRLVSRATFERLLSLLACRHVSFHCRIVDGLACGTLNGEEGGFLVIELPFCMNPGFVRTPMTEGLMSTPEKRAWQVHVPRLMDSEYQVPSDVCAKATLQLLRIAGPDLSGRTFTVHTDLAAVDRDREPIAAQDRYVMRRRM